MLTLWFARIECRSYRPFEKLCHFSSAPRAVLWTCHKEAVLDCQWHISIFLFMSVCLSKQREGQRNVKVCKHSGKVVLRCYSGSASLYATMRNFNMTILSQTSCHYAGCRQLLVVDHPQLPIIWNLLPWTRSLLLKARLNHTLDLISLRPNKWPESCTRQGMLRNGCTCETLLTLTSLETLLLISPAVFKPFSLPL